MWFSPRPAPRVRDELRFHRDRLIEDFIAAGMDRAEAERRAFLVLLAKQPRGARSAALRHLEPFTVVQRVRRCAGPASPVSASRHGKTLLRGVSFADGGPMG